MNVLRLHNTETLFTHTLLLTFPDFTKPFTLDTDANQSGIGAVLLQNVDGQEGVED